MSFSEVLTVNLVVTGVLVFLVWLVSVKLADVSIVDIFWGFGFVVIAWLTFLATANNSPATGRRLLLAVLTTIWGLRLTLHLARRKIGEPEDHRYQAMRHSIGPRFWLISLGVVFGLQGLIMNIVALPIMAGPFEQAPLGVPAVVGVVLWAIGLTFEALGDWQLARFKADPGNRGKVLDQGLWRYTRHPNYFGDFLVWWGLYLVAVGGQFWWTVIGPVLMSVLLMRVSGVTLLERSLQASKPAYAEYQRRTSAFFPRPPRN